ncbi:MAG TPA: hypothetical protein VIW25_14520 [Nitrososphaeraceae archaeon]
MGWQNKSMHTFDLICVDQGAIDCPGNDPNIVSCRRLFVAGIVENEHGTALEIIVS